MQKPMVAAKLLCYWPEMTVSWLVTECAPSGLSTMHE